MGIKTRIRALWCKICLYWRRFITFLKTTMTGTLVLEGDNAPKGVTPDKLDSALLVRRSPNDYIILRVKNEHGVIEEFYIPATDHNKATISAHIPIFEVNDDLELSEIPESVANKDLRKSYKNGG